MSSTHLFELWRKGLSKLLMREQNKGYRGSFDILERIPGELV